MKIKEIKKFIDDSGNSIEFIPNPIPGYSHRVILNGISTRKWLSSEHKPNKKTAEFFLKELMADETYSERIKRLK